MIKRRRLQSGITYLWLLLAIAFSGAVLASAATLWSQAQRRERETELLWVGEQYRRAIEAYAQAGGAAGTYPRSLDELLSDPRSPVPRRFLRRLYRDPMTNSPEWGIVRNEQQGILGVYSQDARVPIKTGNFPAPYKGFDKAESYSDWKFAAAVVAPPPVPPAGKPEGAPGVPQSGLQPLIRPPLGGLPAVPAPARPPTGPGTPQIGLPSPATPPVGIVPIAPAPRPDAPQAAEPAVGTPAPPDTPSPLPAPPAQLIPGVRPAQPPSTSPSTPAPATPTAPPSIFAPSPLVPFPGTPLTPPSPAPAQPPASKPGGDAAAARPPGAQQPLFGAPSEPTAQPQPAPVPNDQDPSRQDGNTPTENPQ